jgi:quercetin dioxygenase-like cupin family protein
MTMTTAEPMKLEPMVPKGQGDVREFPWGRIVWTVAGHLGNSDTLTFGIVTINPGTSNPPHVHPNCDEVLYLLAGRLRHELGDKEFDMKAGDTISIPTGIKHRANVVGDEPAVMAVSFSTPDRQITHLEA